MLNQNFRFLDRVRPALTKFNLTAVHLSIPSVSDTFTFTDTLDQGLLRPLTRNDTISIVEIVPSFPVPFVKGIMFRSPLRFIAFKSPKRNITEPTYKRISFSTYPRKIAFKSIKRIDP